MEKVKELSPRQIKMTRGLAITSMIVLHLFCRKGSDVYGTPLLWTNSQTPLVYWLGFLSEICVGMYCLCSGYAHYRLGETNGLTPKRNGKRLLKFIINFWIVCTLFSFIGLFVNGGKEIPGGMITFLENLTMLNFSYNGAWWFALTYVYLVIFSRLICKAIKNCNSIVTVILLFAQYGAREIIMHLWTIPAGSGRLVSYPLTQLQNFFGPVLLTYGIGMLLAKKNVISKLGSFWLDKLPKAHNYLLFTLTVLGCAVVCVLEKSILMPVFAIFIFIVFQLWQKSKFTEKLFLYLGKHSTNIWLTHMFFYLRLFQGLVQKAKYPPLMFLFMMVLCIASSYIIGLIYKPILKGLKLAK